MNEEDTIVDRRQFTRRERDRKAAKGKFDLLWKILVVLAVGILAMAIFYIAYTVHQHNASIDCMRQGFNTVIGGLNHIKPGQRFHLPVACP